MDQSLTLTIFTKLTSEVSFYTALIAAIVAVWGIKTQRSISRQKNSLDFESVYKRNTEIAAHNSIIISLINAIKENKLANHVDYLKNLAEQNYVGMDDEQVQEGKNRCLSIVTILNEWERTANAMFSNLYDEDYLYRAHGTAIIQIYSGLQPFIEARQSKNPRIFINFTVLAIRWGARRCLEDKEDVSKKLKRQLNNIKQCEVKFVEHAVHEDVHGHLPNLKKAGLEILKIIKPSRLRKCITAIKAKF